MAPPRNSIGGYTFVNMEGAVAPVQTTLTRESIPFRDGARYWAGGDHGEVFQLTTTEEILSYALAEAQMAKYRLLNGTAVDLWRGGVRLGSVRVLKVREARRPQAGTTFGGVLGGRGNAQCYAVWDLEFQ